MNGPAGLRTLLRAGRETALIDLGHGRLEPGATLGVDPSREALVVVLGGVVDAALGGRWLARLGGRASVFEGPGHALFVPDGCAAELTARQAAEIVTIQAPPAVAASRAPLREPRAIGPADQEIVQRGADNWAREVRTLLGPGDPASRLLAGETVNPPGNWSSYPPHKHDVEAPPDEVQLEEVYLFKFEPASGFGVQVRYGTGAGDEAFVVHDGDAFAIRSGYHPVVAAPGYRLYYLWAMAGAGRQMIPRFDPAHAWVQESPS
jgi:5-deoxy-glucuronate isomerase